MKIGGSVRRLRHWFTPNKPWAKSCVRVLGTDVDQLPLPADLQEVARVGSKREVLLFDIPTKEGWTMHDLLASTATFLHEHEQTLAELPDTRIDVFLGWTPKPDQESAVVEADLVEVLARLHGSIYFDMYC